MPPSSKNFAEKVALIWFPVAVVIENYNYPTIILIKLIAFLTIARKNHKRAKLVFPLHFSTLGGAFTTRLRAFFAMLKGGMFFTFYCASVANSGAQVADLFSKLAPASHRLYG